ncbi:hypothetical protein BASA81_014008 [Batrachochytrium salamandrivorans]|nr:hypothetical protein BASA81_014008 [Batrachochytrium salamandrivorans]
MLGLLNAVFSKPPPPSSHARHLPHPPTAPSSPISFDNPEFTQPVPLSHSSTSFRKSRITSVSNRKKHHALQLNEEEAAQVNIKIALVGSAQCGKTSLVQRFNKDRFTSEYVPTRMVCLEEKLIRLRRGTANLALCDLGAIDSSSRNLVYLACGDAQSVLFCFDLTRRSTLLELKDWYAQIGQVNFQMGQGKVAVILVGLKYDLFDGMDLGYRTEMLELSRKYAQAMHATGLVFTSSRESINVMKLFKIIVGVVGGIECFVEQRHLPTEPVIEY